MALVTDVDGRRVTPEVAKLFAAIRRRPVVSYDTLGVQAARDLVSAAIKLQGEVPSIDSTTDIVVGDEHPVPVRIYRATSASDVLIVYLHGGGWVTGDLESSDIPCRQLAAATGAIVASVDYRLSPEQPHPAAHDDAVSAIAKLAALREDLGAQTDRLIVLGDSAGANLGVTATLHLRELVTDLVLLYPAVSPPGRDPCGSYATNADDPILSRNTMQWFWDQYLGTPPTLIGETIDPTLASDLSGMPRTLLVTCGLDVLQDEGQRLASVLHAAGIDVTFECIEGMVHGFMWMGGVFPDVQRTLGLIASWVRLPHDENYQH
ncbi:alpha/beta hydrolase [soil metagenome]